MFQLNFFIAWRCPVCWFNLTSAFMCHYFCISAWHHVWSGNHRASLLSGDALGWHPWSWHCRFEYNRLTSKCDKCFLWEHAVCLNGVVSSLCACLWGIHKVTEVVGKTKWCKLHWLNLYSWCQFLDLLWCPKSSSEHWISPCVNSEMFGIRQNDFFLTHGKLQW